MISFLSIQRFFREINFQENFSWNWFHWCCAATEIYLPILVLRSFFPWNCRPRHKTWGLFARRRARYISFLTLKSVHSNYYYSLKKNENTAPLFTLLCLETTGGAREACLILWYLSLRQNKLHLCYIRLWFFLCNILQKKTWISFMPCWIRGTTVFLTFALNALEI